MKNILCRTLLRTEFRSQQHMLAIQKDTSKLGVLCAKTAIQNSYATNVKSHFIQLVLPNITNLSKRIAYSKKKNKRTFLFLFPLKILPIAQHRHNPPLKSRKFILDTIVTMPNFQFCDL